MVTRCISVFDWHFALLDKTVQSELGESQTQVSKTTKLTEGRHELRRHRLELVRLWNVCLEGIAIQTQDLVTGNVHPGGIALLKVKQGSKLFSGDPKTGHVRFFIVDLGRI